MELPKTTIHRKEVSPEVPSYYRVKVAINAAVPFLAPTQAANLALLVSAILKKRTLCPSEPAGCYPTPEKAARPRSRARPASPPKEALAFRR